MLILSTIRACLTLLAVLDGAVGFGLRFGGVEYRYDLLTEAPLIQTAFVRGPGLFGRQACPSGYVTHLSGCCLAGSLTDCGDGVTVCTASCPASTTAADSCPSGYVTHLSGCCLSIALTDCGNGVTVCTAACPASSTTAQLGATEAPPPEPTFIGTTATSAPVATGCAAGFGSFDGGCCASASLLECAGTTLCTSQCPVVQTSTTSLPPPAPSSTATTSNPVVVPVVTSPTPLVTTSSTPAQPLSTSLSSTSTATATPTPSSPTSSLSSSISSSPSSPSSTSPPALVTQTATISVIPLQPSTSFTTTPSTSGLSTGAKAGIGIGVALIFLILLAICIFLVFTRRKRSAEEKAAPGPPPAYTSELPGHMFGRGEGYGVHGRHELGAGRFSEMAGVEVFRGHELDAK